MRSATIVQLLHHKKRLLGIALAIMIGVGFMTSTMLFGQVIDQSFRNSVGAEYRNIDLVVEAVDTSIDPAMVPELEAIDGVADVHSGATAWLDVANHGQSTSVTLGELPSEGALRQALKLEEGRFPEQPGEVVLSRSMANDLRLGEGDTFDAPVPIADTMTSKTFTLVGIWSGTGRYGDTDLHGFLDPGDFAAWEAGSWIPALYIVLDDDADAAAILDIVTVAAGSSAQVLTGTDKIDAEMAEFADAASVQKLGINAFALLALVVAGIVVSNTFAILVAQRTRDIALFRCAGATANQIRRMVLSEAAILGLIASAAGVAGALVLVNIGLWAVNTQLGYSSVPSSIGVSPAEVIFPIVVGMILAISAAWVPSRSATRVDPLQALRASQSPAGAGQRPGRLQIGLSLLLLAGGIVLLAGGAIASRAGSPPIGVLIGMAGGILAFLGVLAGASVLVPATVSLFGRAMSQIGGVPARVAASNGVRNPRRTTATTIALVIGVALVTMMSVGAESLKATLVGEIDETTPWDLDVQQSGATRNDDAFAELIADGSGLEGIDAGATMGAIDATILGTSGEDTEFVAKVVDPAALATVWRDAASIAGFEPGTALVPGWVLEVTGISDGDTFAIEIGGQPLELVAIATAAFDSMVLTDADVAELGVTPTVDSLWIKLNDDGDRDGVKRALYDLADERGVTIEIGGLGGYRETLTSALDALVYVITALLGVAVLIAIIGVSNTLSLSVIERTRESALLRALGFTRRQLRQSLAMEGVLLAMIGSVIGIVLGTGFGWIGAITVVGDTWPVSLALPVTRIAIIVLVAIICGLVASILPARRAAQADPVVSLADS